jgi:hypothetical protein
MMTRSATTTFAGRASNMRRLRRRASLAGSANRPYCRTNGCASFLELDQDERTATCPVCGFTLRLH